MSTTDPYLLEEDQRHARTLRPHTLHDHEHEHQGQRGDGGDSPSGSGSNRLNDFASHILESRPHTVHNHDGEDTHEHEHEHEHTHNHVLSFTGEGGVLESQVGVGTFDTDVENAMRQAMDDGEFQPHIDHVHDHDHSHSHDDGQGQLEHDGGTTNSVPKPRRNNYTRARKRKAGEVDDNGAAVDPVQIKKELHVCHSHPSPPSSPTPFTYPDPIHDPASVEWVDVLSCLASNQRPSPSSKVC